MRTWHACWLLALLLMAAQAAGAGERQNITKVRRLAEAMVAATFNGDYAVAIDHTYDGVVKELGGREEAIRIAEASMRELKAKGFTLKSYVVSTPQGFSSAHGVMFTIVPTRLEMQAPDAWIVTRSYLLGISSDAGESWRFVDGSGLDDAAFRERVLPKLPAGFTLPPSQKPEITRFK